jgi:hypothetical protein
MATTDTADRLARARRYEQENEYEYRREDYEQLSFVLEEDDD